MMKMKKMLTDKFITDELCHYFCRMPGHRFGFHMEIYFDEMDVYKDYSDIPFILIGNTYDMNDYDFLALTIEECPKMLIKKDVHIFREDYIRIINWISKNRAILSAFANDEIDFSDAMSLLSVDNKIIDVPEPVAKDIEWTILYTFSNGYSIVLNKNFNYNVENPDGELISDIWFSEISYELNRDKDGIYFVCYDYINDKIYKLYTDSHFVLEKLNPDDYTPIIRKYKIVNENRNFFLRNRPEREISLHYLRYLFPKMR